MRSASRGPTPLRLAAFGCAGALLLGAASGCQTTQEKAAAKQAEAQRILKAREQRQAERKKGKDKRGTDDQPQRKGGGKR